jgi:hypothetical protein
MREFYCMAAQVQVRQIEESSPVHKGWAAKGFWFLLYAGLLACVELHHEMYIDETQVWLLARDSRSVIEMLGHLRYEGHPALWYLLVYPLAHLQLGLCSMQALNYLISLVMAGLLLTERRISAGLRVLLLFGVFPFFHMGVLVRSYMLAAVLLVAAARCLTGKRPRRLLAMVFLALAINTHFLAIPVAASIFLWLYWLRSGDSLRMALSRVLQAEWIQMAGVVLAGLLLCYLTVRPAPDLATPHYDVARLNNFDYLLISIGRVWNYFVPIPLGLLPTHLQDLLTPWQQPSLVAVALSLALGTVVIASLPSRQSRYFVLTAWLLFLAVIALTTRRPTPFHASFMWVAYAIGLTLITSGPNGRPWLNRYLAPQIVTLLLGVQLLGSLIYGLQDIHFAFSGAKATADYLRSSALMGHPLIIEPDSAAPSILAYTGVSSAYFPTCHCSGSFTVFRRGRDVNQQVTLMEFKQVERDRGAVPVVISHTKLSDGFLQETGLRQVYQSPHGVLFALEDLTVYAAGKDGSK